jgi:hypothetical protein
MPVAVRFSRGKCVAAISFKRDVSDLSVMMAVFAFEAHQERGNRPLERNPLLRRVFGKPEVLAVSNFVLQVHTEVDDPAFVSSERLKVAMLVEPGQ